MAIYIPIVSEFKSAGIDKAKKEFKSLEGFSAKAGFAVKKAAIPAAAALGALAAGAFDAAKGAMEDAAAQDLLANNLRKTTGATDAQIAANEEWISTQGRLLGVADDKLRPVLSKLSKATGSVTKAQELATQAMDIAAATGKPLETVTTALEKAYGGNLTALTKLAPEYRDLVKDGADFEEVMDKLAKTTGGAATEAANTAQGKFGRLKVSMDETKESIGAALLPIIEKTLPVLEKFADWASENPTAFMAIAGAIGAIALAITAVNIAMALNPIALIAAGIAILIVGLVVAYKKFEGFRKIVDNVFGAIKWWINNVTIPAFELMLSVVKTIFNGIARLWNNTFGKLSFKAPSWVPFGLGGKGFDVPDIPLLAAGGIVTSPTLAMVGEAGPEAVIPLDRLGAMGAGGDVNIYVQGADPQAVVDALRTYMFRNGSVPIRVS
jgi:ElaB/YqjD/DUF883 family membrane-anchored ribosome-binding protein